MHELGLRSIGSDFQRSSIFSAEVEQQPAESTVVSSALDAVIRILVCIPNEANATSLHAYGNYLCDLFQGQLTILQATSRDYIAQFKQARTESDLVVFGTPEQSPLDRFVHGPVARQVVAHSQASILVTYQPRWPIRKVLLIVRVEEPDRQAVDWAGCLAKLSDAQVTILPLVPSAPLMYRPGSALQVGLESLLAPDSVSGQHLRRLLKQLRRWEVDGTLHIRYGEPAWQICWEIDEGDHDLVVIGADPCSRWKRWLFGELIGPLLGRVNQPLLIANPKPSQGLFRRPSQSDKGE